MKLKDQVAVVTGAGRNIGEEIAKLFAAEGAKVAVVDMDRPRGERVVAAIRGAGGEAELFTADVSNGGDVAALVEAVVERFGRIDVLVNNVAISDNKHIFDISEEEWDRVLAVTLKSQFLMGKHVGLQMAKQGTGGRIIKACADCVNLSALPGIHVLFHFTEETWMAGPSPAMTARMDQHQLLSHYTFALIKLASGLPASARSLALTGTPRSMRRRASAISRWALMPHA
jgi:Enoyl-(Acyl carrier protein) reductase